MPSDLSKYDIMALEFLLLGPDEPGVIDSEEKLAALLVFSGLRGRGLVAAQPGDEGPAYSITPAGRIALGLAQAQEGGTDA